MKKHIKIICIVAMLILGLVFVYLIGNRLDSKLKLNTNSIVDSIPVITNTEELSKDIESNINNHEVFISGKISSVTTVNCDGLSGDDYILVKEVYETKEDDSEYKVTKENVETALYARILDVYINVNKILFMNPDIEVIQNIDDDTRKQYKVIKNDSEGILHAHIANGKIVSGKFYKGYSVRQLKETMYIPDDTFDIASIFITIYIVLVFLVLLCLKKIDY